MTGRIKTWNSKKGFGFLIPDGGGDDLFFHVSSVLGDYEPREGDVVDYTMGQGRDRRARAENVKLSAERPPVSKSAVKTGRVKFWNNSKGYGFFIPDDGGDDIFAHVKNLPPGVDMLEQDEEVRFAIGNGKDGRPQAVDINFG